MKRGDIVIAAAPGDFGKPRPAVIVQADVFALSSFTIAPLTSYFQDAPLLRIPVEPDDANGLQCPSHVMIDKILTISRAKIRQQIGTLDLATMRRVNRALLLFLALEDGAA